MHQLHLALYMGGGFSLGTGILNLYWSFGMPTGPLNQNLAVAGFNGLDNLTLLPAADYSIVLVIMGICCMVIANATAWKQTGGY